MGPILYSQDMVKFSPAATGNYVQQSVLLILILVVYITNNKIIIKGCFSLVCVRYPIVLKHSKGLLGFTFQEN